MLDAWWSLTGAGVAVARAGMPCTVLQAAWTDAVRERNGVEFRFVADATAPAWLPNSEGLLRHPRRLIAAARASDPDVVHVHGFLNPLQIGMLAGRLASVPVLVQDHAARVPRGWRRALYRRGLRDIAGVAFAAREQADPFFAAGILRAGVPVVQVMEGSCDFSPGDQDAARATTGMHGNPCLLWVGNLDDNKDPLTVLDALSRARRRLSDPHLWCWYRAAPLLDVVRRFVEGDPALRGRVHLMGPRSHDDLETCYRAADLFVSGSHKEGSGYAAIEALACGTPLTVTDIPSFRTIAGGGVAGALVPPGDAAVMADALIAWSERARGPARTVARAHFEHELSWAAIGRQLRHAYETLRLR